MIREFPAVLFLLFTAWSAFAFEPLDHVTYFGTTDQSLTVSWDEQSAATYFEIVLFHVERKVEAVAGSGRTETNSITFKLPRSGHFVAKIRACNDELTPPCSPWTESTDDELATVDGEKKGWWLYGHVAAPNDIIVNQIH